MSDKECKCRVFVMSPEELRGYIRKLERVKNGLDGQVHEAKIAMLKDVIRAMNGIYVMIFGYERKPIETAADLYQEPESWRRAGFDESVEEIPEWAMKFP